MILGFFAYLYSEGAITMEKRKTWWLLLSVAIVNVVGGIVVQALVWIGPVFRSQSSAVGQWLLLWNLVQGLLVVASGYLGVNSYLKEQRKATRATEVELFDHTIDALGYFNDDVVPEMDRSIATYLELLHPLHLGKHLTKAQRYLLGSVIKESHFERVFQRLNVLSGFVHYDMINESQMYASVWDELSRLLNVPFFEEIVVESQKQRLMNNYLDFIESSKKYAAETKLRRS